MYRSILCPTDGTQAANAGLEEGLRLAMAHDATVHALAVVDGPRTDGGTRGDHEALVDAREGAGAFAIPIETAVATGHPGEEILSYAAEAAVDLLVLGTAAESHGGRLEGVVGRVLEDSAVPTVLVPGGTSA